MCRGVSTGRVAVTGIGIVCGLGNDAPTVVGRLFAGDRGFSEVSLFDVDGCRCRIAAQVRTYEHEEDELDPGPSLSRSDAMAVRAAREAIASSGIDRRYGYALAVGGTTGGMREAESVLESDLVGDPTAVAVKRLLTYPLATTAERLIEGDDGVREAATVCSACSSGAVAIVQAAAWIEAGRAQRVVAGGTDGLCRLTFTGFNSLAVLDPGPCRPFDVERRGLTLGEGAAFLVLEDENAANDRGATVLAVLSGWAIGAEAHHITRPEPSGETAARLIREAMDRAGLCGSDIDYINAHGTGTRSNDATEGRAIRAALGRSAGRVAVSSSKGQIGHTLGAAGAIEAALTVVSIRDGRIPSTGGLAAPDVPELDFVLGRARTAEVRAALSNSFGFGGTGCVLAFEHPTFRKDHRTGALRRVVVTGASVTGKHGVLVGTDCALHAGRRDDVPAKGGTLELPLDAARTRRFDRTASMTTSGVARALESARVDESVVGLVAGTAFGNVERCVGFLRRVAEMGPRFAPPAEFPRLVPSAAAGNASIYLGLRGPVLSVSDLQGSTEIAVHVAASLVETGSADVMAAGGAEARDPVVAELLGRLFIDGSCAARGEGSGWLVLEPLERACARGASVLAEVIDRRQVRGDHHGAARAVRSPRVPGRSVVVSATHDRWLDEVVRDSGWASVACATVLEASGFHEALGGIALATACALVATAADDEALVCGRAPGRVVLTHLQGVGE